MARTWCVRCVARIRQSVREIVSGHVQPLRAPRRWWRPQSPRPAECWRSGGVALGERHGVASNALIIMRPSRRSPRTAAVWDNRPTVSAGGSRQSGSTPSERLVADLAERSFLGLWSYANVHRDQGRPGEEDGKEVCDLIAVFRDDVLLFSVKECAFPPGDIGLAWTRWYRRAVQASVKQLKTAERWIRDHPHRLYLDNRCTQRFPIDLPPPDRLRIHRLAISLGAASACAAHHGPSGSLLLAPMEPSPLDPRVDGDSARPFVVGGLADPFVHVLDDVTLPLLMRELDTPSDLIGYLRRKERFIRNNHLLFSSGEEHLLAWYLRSVGFEDEDFPEPPDGRALVLDNDLWPGLVESTEYLEMKDSLRESYAWDRMVEALSQDILFQRTPFWNEGGIAAHERNVRALASAPRVVRRDLAPLFFEMLKERVIGHRYRALRHPYQPDTAYLILVMARDEALDYEGYRRRRVQLLGAHAHVFAKNCPDVRHVIGISIGPADSNGDASHEVVYLDRAGWTVADDALADTFERELGATVAWSRNPP
jgi:hypothetical protein